MDTYVILKVRIENMIDQETLDHSYDGSLIQCAQHMIDDNGLAGLIEDDIEVINAGWAED